MSTSGVGGLLRERAREHPDKLFLWSGDDRMTYAEVDQRSDQIAGGLSKLGIGAGDRVAFLSANRTEMLEMFFACAKLGAIQAPFNAALRGDFLQYQLGDCQPSALVVDSAGLGAAMDVIGSSSGDVKIVALDADSGSSSSGVIPYEQLRDEGPAPETDLGPGDLLSIVYTSGTTGMPKGCMLPHGYYLNIGESVGQAFAIEPQDVILTSLPMFHVAARAMLVVGALVRHAACVVDTAFHPGTVLTRARETGATLYGGVGAMGMALLGQPASEDDRNHGLTRAIFIPFPPAMQQKFEERFGIPVNAELYGQTECLPATYSIPGGPRSAASMGLPAPYLDVAVVDDEDREVPVGEIGEIVLRPKKPFAMFSGYWNKGEDTMKTWRNLWHHTGDYAKADEQGFLYFVDRKKDALRRRGENVSSMQLEMVIAQHPKLAEAAVHAVPSDMTEDDIKACVVVQPGEQVTPEELAEFFQSQIPAYAVPRYVEVVPDLPKNATMRVMKHRLRDRGVTDQTWDLHGLGLLQKSK